MRKFYIVLLPLLFLLATFKAEGQTIFLEESFEGEIPWTRENVLGSTSWQFTTAYKYDGSRSIYLASGTGRISRLISPVLDLSDGNEPITLSFYNRQTAASGGGNDSLRIYYRTSSTSPWNHLVSFTNATTNWVYREVPLLYIGSTYQIAIEGVSNGNGGVYIDAVEISEAPLCSQPSNLYLNKGTQESATLNWNISNDGGNLTTSYQLKVSTTPIGNLLTTTGDIFDGTITSSDNSYPLTNLLSANTTYYVYLRANCTAAYKGYSDFSTVSFTTPCHAVKVPLTENFDNISSGLPSCWLSAGTYPILPSVSSTYKYGTAGNSLRISSSVEDNAYIISPPIDTLGNSIEISFQLYAATSNQRLQVMLMSDPFDISTAVEISDFTVKRTGRWEKYVINTSLSGITEEKQYLVLYSPAGVLNTVYIDDIDIHGIPPCLRPEELNVSQIGNSSALLAWNEIGAATQWEIEYLTENDTLYTIANSNPFLLDDLTGNTDYKVRLRAICSSQDSSEYSLAEEFTTKCEPIFSADLPYFENFDTYTTSTTAATGAYPDCWTNTWITGTLASQSPQIYYGGTYSTSGSYSFRLYYKAMVTLPELGVPLNTLRVKFKMKAAEAYSLIVGVIENPSDSSSFVPLDTIAGLGTANTIDAEVRFNRYSGTGKYIALKNIHPSYAYSYVYLDDVTIEELPSCLSPINISVSTDTTSATISWQDGQNWELIVSSGEQSDTISVPGTGNGTYTIPDLSPNTEYKYTVYLRSICSEDTSDVFVKEISFTTLCLPLRVPNLPYTEDFDSYTTSTTAATGFFPDCWTNVWCRSTTASYNPQIYYYATYATSGAYSFRMYYESIVALPKVDIPVNTLRIKFKMKTSSTAYHLIVGVLDNPADKDSFVPVDTIAGNGSTTTAVNIVVPFDTYTGTGKYIALQNYSPTYDYAYVYIDDLLIGEIPACADILNDAWSIDSISLNSIKVAVSDPTITDWDIEYGEKGFTLGEGILINVSSPDTTYLLTPLEAATAYDIYVRRNCGNDIVGEWSESRSVTTYQIPAELPYLCDFDDPDHGWTLENGNQGNVWIVDTDVQFSGSSSLYISQKDSVVNTYAASTSSVWAYRTINIPEEGGYSFLFNWKARGESTYDYLRAFLVPQNVVLTGGDAKGLLSGTSGNTTPAGWMAVDSGVRLNLKEEWQSLENEIYIENAGAYNLVFYWRNDGSVQNQPPAAVDDVSVFKTSCARPMLNNVANVTDTSATLSWRGVADSYKVILSTKAFSVNQLDTVKTGVVLDSVLTVNSLEISDLAVNTYFYYYVKAYCGTDDSSRWSAQGFFKTECLPLPLPYYESFEANDSTSHFECWFVKEGTITTNTTYKYGGLRSVSASGVTAISPRFDTPSLGTYQLSGYAYSTSDSAQFIVGVMSDPNDAGTYEPLALITLYDKNVWTEFVSYFSPLVNDPELIGVANAKYVVMSVASDYVVYFDDLSIDTIPDCPKPTRLRTSNLTDNSVTVDWISNVETKWQLQLTKNDSEVVLDTIVTSHPVNLDNLSALTEYRFSVRAICLVSDSSEWAYSSKFKTDCPLFVKLPYFENFDNYTTSTTLATGAYPDCWTNAAVTGTLATQLPQIYYGTTYSTSGDYSFRMYYKSTVALPQVEEPVNTLRLRFKARSSSTAYRLIVGVMENLSDLDSFVPVDTIIPSASAVATINDVDISFESYTGAGKYIVFKNDHATYAYSYFYLDDVKLDVNPTCIEPSYLSVNDVRWDGATVSWGHEDNAPTFRVKVAQGEIVNPYEPTGTIVIDSLVAGNSLSMSELDGNTEYSVYVSAICSAQDSSYSESISFKTACPPILLAELPIIERFDSYTTTTTLATGAYPDCWTNVMVSSTTASSNPQIYYGTTYSTSGNYSFRMYYKSVVALPAIEDVTPLRLRFKTRSSSVDYRLIVGVLDDISSDASFVPIDTIQGTSAVANIIDANVIFASYAGTGKYIAFKNEHPSYAYSYFYIDDLKIEVNPTCVEPSNFSLDGVRWDGATVNWSHKDNASTFRVKVVQGEFVDTYGQPTGLVLIDTIVAGNSFSATELESNTQYAVYVSAICSAQDSSYFDGISFTTSCDPITLPQLPYTENFDSYTTSTTPATGAYPDCWTNVMVSSATASSNPQIYYGTTYSTSGNYSFRMYYKSVVALPAVEDVSPLRIRFKARSSSVDYRLIVGVLDDISSDASFVPIDTIQGTSAVANVIDAYVSFSSYSGTGKYIAFKNEHATYAYSYFYIDDVKIDIEPTCLPPTATVDSLEWSAVKLAFSHSNASAFRVKVATSQLANPEQSSSEVVKDTIVTGISAVISGLSPQTQYYTYVRAFCSATDSSEYSNAVSFKTTRVATTVPYACGFEEDAENALWSTVNGTQANKWLISGKDPTAPYEGTKALYISNNDSAYNYTLTSTSTTWALRTLAFDKGVYDVSFVWQAYGQTTNDYLRAFLAPVAEDAFTAGSLSVSGKSVSATATPSGWIALDNGTRLNEKTGWQKLTYPSLVVSERTLYNLVFVWRNNNTLGTQPPAAIDSISIIKYDCAPAINVFVDNITENEAVVRWTNLNAVGTPHEVVYVPAGTPVDAGTPLTATNDSLVLSELDPATAYDVYVRVICSETQSPWTQVVLFKTKALPVTVFPHFADFENETENNSWELLNGTQTNQWHIGTAGKAAGSKGLYISNDAGVSNAYTITGLSYVYAYRTLDLEENSTYQIDFDWSSYGENNWDVGRAFLIPDNIAIEAGNAYGMTGSANTAPAGWIDLMDGQHMSLKEGWTHQAGIAKTSVAGLYKLVFFWKNDGIIGTQPPAAIDNVKIEKILCVQPTLRIDSIGSSDAARISWDSEGAGPYKIKVSTTPIDLESVSTAIVPLDTTLTGTSILLTELSPSTTYYVYGQTVCTDVLSSNWSSVSFTTSCEPIGIPYTESFDYYTTSTTAATGEYPDCWTNVWLSSTTASSNPQIYYGTTYSTSGNYSFRMYYKSIVALPEIDEPVQNLSLQFKMRTSSTAYSLIVGVMDNLADTSSFVPVMTIPGNAAVSEVIDTTVLFTNYTGNGKYIAFKNHHATYAYSYVYLDDIRISCYGGERIVSDEICSGYGYASPYFNISRDQLAPGLNTFSKLKTSLSSVECDTTITLNLYVGASSKQIIRDTICSGEVYAGNGFSGIMKSGIYENHLSSALGCDSIVRLNLRVYQISETVDATICEGQDYPFGDRLLTQSGIYIDTLFNASVRGCDSISTVNLKVIPNFVHATVDLCENGTYLFGDTTLTTSGTYIRTLTNSLGCDSVVTLDLKIHQSIEYLEEAICRGSIYEFIDTILTTPGFYVREVLNPAGCRTRYEMTLTVLDPETISLLDYVCEGTTYNNHGFVGLVITKDTILYETLASKLTGCDSINEIDLRLIPPVYFTDSVTIKPGDVYNWQGNSYTIAGTYGPETDRSVITGCDSIVTLVLSVTSSLDNIFSRPFTVSPNPVQRNEFVTVNYEFTLEERRGLRVEIVNSVGQVIQHYNPNVYPIRVEDLSVSGFYLIKITTGTGSLYHGSVIVK